MTVATVTIDDVLTRFPQFEGQDDQIEALLAEAYLIVDDNWAEEDQAIAIKYLVAHWLVAEDSADSLRVTSESLGPISVSYAAPKDLTGYLVTEWGRRFVELRKRNFGGPVVI